MNRLGERLSLRADRRLLGILAGIGLIVFLVLQVLPVFTNESPGAESGAVISKEKAIDAALSFTLTQWKDADPELASGYAIYDTDKLLYGYLTANRLLNDYNRKFEREFPYDTYRVELKDRSVKGKVYYVYVHMQTGKVARWSIYTPPAANKEGAAADPDGRLESAVQFAGQMGYRPEQLKEVSKGYAQNGLYTVVLQDTSRTIGQSGLEIRVQFRGPDVVGFKPAFTVPESHAAYVKKQSGYASWMTGIGYGLLTLALAVLAVVYSALTRSFTSFKRGILLAVVYTAVNIIGTFNMFPALKSMLGETPTVDVAIYFGIIVQSLFTLALGASIYFSLVAGDGLWRKRGLNPWPRPREAGYGDYTFRSMWIGYLTAFILLGLQPVIFIGLSSGIGTWFTTDASQSPYNMTYPWLFPLLAWGAGIGEEAVYRLFGIAIMKKLVRNTFLACLIPTLIWAFGHTGYQVYPTYSRVIELTILGLIFSFIFLRYGFIAAVFAHVVFDSVLFALNLMFMGGTGNILWGIFYLILPALVAWIIRALYRRRNTKEEPQVTTPPPEALV